MNANPLFDAAAGALGEARKRNQHQTNLHHARRAGLVCHGDCRRHRSCATDARGDGAEKRVVYVCE
jgi:hypothetical protein